MVSNRRIQSEREEKLNFWTHFLTLIAFLGFAPVLFPKIENTLLVWANFSFLLGIVATYGASSIYHYLPRNPRKTIWRVIDHICIFFLIGGTYNPIIITYVSQPYATIFLSVLWGIILVGIVLKILFVGRYKTLSTVLYVFLGWMVVFVAVPLYANMPTHILYYIVFGGLAYSIGVYFFRKDRKPYYHTIWHLFVSMGTVFHFMAIYHITDLSLM